MRVGPRSVVEARKGSDKLQANTTTPPTFRANPCACTTCAGAPELTWRVARVDEWLRAQYHQQYQLVDTPQLPGRGHDCKSLQIRRNARFKRRLNRWIARCRFAAKGAADIHRGSQEHPATMRRASRKQWSTPTMVEVPGLWSTPSLVELVAEEAKSNRNTVGRVRVKLQEFRHVSLSDTRKDTKGRKQPAKKVKAAKPKADRKQVEEMIERQTCALAAIAAREEQRQKLPAEAARIELKQLDNVTKNADFGADVIVESPSIMMTDPARHCADSVRRCGQPAGCPVCRMGAKQSEVPVRRARAGRPSRVLGISQERDQLQLSRYVYPYFRGRRLAPFSFGHFAKMTIKHDAELSAWAGQASWADPVTDHTCRLCIHWSPPGERVSRTRCAPLATNTNSRRAHARWRDNSITRSTPPCRILRRRVPDSKPIPRRLLFGRSTRGGTANQYEFPSLPRYAAKERGGATYQPPI